MTDHERQTAADIAQAMRAARQANQTRVEEVERQGFLLPGLRVDTHGRVSLSGGEAVGVWVDRVDLIGGLDQDLNPDARRIVREALDLDPGQTQHAVRDTHLLLDGAEEALSRGEQPSELLSPLLLTLDPAEELNPGKRSLLELAYIQDWKVRIEPRGAVGRGEPSRAEPGQGGGESARDLPPQEDSDDLEVERRGQVYAAMAGACLIACDIDWTLIDPEQHRAREHFLNNVAPALTKAAQQGAHLAFITGNSLEKLTERLLSWLVEHLIFTKQLGLLSRCYFFVNKGAAHIRFPLDEQLLHATKFWDRITAGVGSSRVVSSRFVDTSYTRRCAISDEESRRVRAILEEVGREYWVGLDRASLTREYDVDRVRSPWVEQRVVRCGDPEGEETVQLTLKPILSFNHARADPMAFIGQDPRSRLVEVVQRRLDAAGLSHYVACVGGWTSIDVGLHKVDKRYALEWLIKDLNLEGQERFGQRLGSRTLFVGDEVVTGGNDFSVTQIPGLLVFAVNRAREQIPYLGNVISPAAVLVGPDATVEVLNRFNRIARQTIERARRASGPPHRSAIEAFKEEYFLERINKKLDALKSRRPLEREAVEELHTLHALVTLYCREDEKARRWIRLLGEQLDGVMRRLGSPFPAQGVGPYSNPE